MGDTSGIIAASQLTSGAASAYGQYQAGRYNSAIHRYNARVAELQAKDALKRGDVAAGDLRKQVRQLKGAQRAAAAAQGIVVDQDVAADLLEDTDRQAAEDERRIKLNAALEAWGYRVQATDSRARAQLARFEARNDAAGTLLASTARFADTGYRAGWFDKKSTGSEDGGP